MREMNVAPHPLEMWGGVECTVNRIGNVWFDQTVRSGHETRRSDLDALAGLGIRALRYPVLWERMAPVSLDEIDWRWTDERLNRIRELGVRPIVGLVHHGSGPAYTSLIDDEFPDKLARFASAVAQRYPWITDFTPVNEPLTTARFSALYGHWYPHQRSDAAFVRAMINQLRGTVLAMRAIREVIPDARLIQTEDCGSVFGTSGVRAQVEFENQRRWLTWDLLAGHVTHRHPLWAYLSASGMTDADAMFFIDAGCPADIIGLNYYLTSDRYLDDHVERYPPATIGSNGRIRYADVEAVRVRRDGIVGHRDHLLAAWRRYETPLAITEAHLGCTREEQLRWLLESWRGALEARQQGGDIRAVTAWALLGAYDWDSLVTRDQGHYEPGAFDLNGPSPRPTALVGLIKTLANHDDAARDDQEITAHPAADGDGWWRRPERLVYGTRGHSSPTITGQPVLIIGASGTLGRAFQRKCAARGLACHLVGRPELDITDAVRVDATLRRVAPWAVINAAGYVRVDDAEKESGACWRANVIGPVNLAAACRRNRIPFVTFSSDLVFDGLADRPYTEQDEPNPLNVYGVTKAEAERHVLSVLPDALVIRTSAFFGPWDEYNFLARLLHTLDAGRHFDAPDDSVVSPTYVPDLVDAALDLLIDGAGGIWHLANDGAVTWFDFAVMAAERAGGDVERIRPVATALVCGPAVRPRYSALTTARGMQLRPLTDALDAYLERRQQRTVTAGASVRT